MRVEEGDEVGPERLVLRSPSELHSVSRIVPQNLTCVSGTVVDLAPTAASRTFRSRPFSNRRPRRGAGDRQFYREAGRRITASRVGHGGPSRSGTEQYSPCSFPIRELVTPIAAPRRDHAENEATALVQQLLISTRIVGGDFFGHMGQIELDRPVTTRLEVDEEQPVLRREHVARMRLTVQQLLDGAAPAISCADLAACCARSSRSASASVGVVLTTRSQLLCFQDSIREMRCGDIDVPHAGMKSLERRSA